MSQTTDRIYWTTEDLKLLPDSSNRYEIIDGHLLVTRAPHWKHQKAIVKVSSILDTWSETSQLGETVATAGVIFADADNVIPDVVIFRIDLPRGCRSELDRQLSGLHVFRVDDPTVAQTGRHQNKAIPVGVAIAIADFRGFKHLIRVNIWGVSSIPPLLVTPQPPSIVNLETKPKSGVDRP